MMALSLRPYQSQCVQKSRETNIIINLPTGHGKTLIAVQRVDDTLPRKVGFLVPTRPLVEQQAAYVEKYSSHNPRITKLIGEDQACWNKADWEKCLVDTDVFVGTAAVFTKAFVTDRFLDLRHFGLLVFDECHNAVGNSPMASLMRDAVVPYFNARVENRRSLSILGLTASFVNGSLKNLPKKRKALEALMQASIFSPDISSTADSSASKFHEVPWVRDDVEEQIDIISRYVDESIERIGKIKEVEKVIKRCVHVFEELGKAALLYFVQNIIINQINDKVKQLEADPGDKNRQQLARRIAANTPRVERETQTLLGRLQYDTKLGSIRNQNHKLLVLIDLLTNLLNCHGPSYRGIVFVEQVALVSPLAQALNAERNLNLSAGAIAGTGHQSDTEREKQLSDFRAGRISILVSTATLEEGIDVPECSFVVRYTRFSTTKSHIQGSGRARNTFGNIYYFANAVMEEKGKAKELESMARKSQMSLNQLELQSCARAMVVEIPGRHPYPFAALERTEHGVVNVFNCKQILNQYCSKVLGTSISPNHHLYTFNEDRTVINKVRFPTPQGWMSINSRQCIEFWSNADLEILFPADRSMNLNKAAKQEACIVYYAVVELRAMGLLDPHNRPTASCVGIIHRCPLKTNSDYSITVKSLVLQSRSN